MIKIWRCPPEDLHTLTREALRTHILTADHPTILRAWLWHDSDAVMVERVGRPPAVAVRKASVVQVVLAEGILEALAGLGDNPAWYLLADPATPLEDVQALLARWHDQNQPHHEMALALLTGLSGCNLANAGPKLSASMHNLLQTAARCALSLGIPRRDFYNTTVAAYDTVRGGKLKIEK